MKLKYNVGTRYTGIDKKEVSIVVQDFGKPVPNDLEYVLVIKAKSTEQAAIKYVEKITGKRAAMQKPLN